MRELLWIAVGGAVGSVARYGVFKAFSGTVGTMVANITGAFVLGFVVGAFSQKLDPVIGLGVTVGLLGGYTTFSTWMFDSVQLWRDGQFAAASINVGVAVLLGLAAAGAGLALGLAVDKGRSAV
ncbi:MAG: CrcB family protein [Acidimicrobiia bacterium]|nr:CrcB family protein [Acidimicrobiia bacterium]